MAFETEGAKSTLIMYDMGKGRLRFSGLVRQTNSDGTTSMRITNCVDNSIVFDDMTVEPPPSSGVNSDISLTHFSSDWSVSLDNS